MSEVDLSDDYANAKYIADAKSFPGKWQAKATNFRNNKTLLSNVELDIRYGASEREKMDIFYPKIRTVGLFVFIHGGYWRAFDKSSWSHLSLGALENGFASAIPSYRLCPEVSIAQITEDIARCITLLSKKVNEGPIVLAGHSAGVHLVSSMLCVGVLPKNVSDRLKRVTPISPLADLQPLIFTDLNSDNKKIDKSKLTDKPVCIIIGPEGDFSEAERDQILSCKTVQSIKINENILRAETAAISSISIINYYLGL